MTINPKHHLNNEISESIEDYYYDRYDYYDYDPEDDLYYDYVPYSNDKEYTYAFIVSLNKLLYSPKLKDHGDEYVHIQLYEDDNGFLYADVYAYTHFHKLTAFMGCIFKVMNDMENPPNKLISLYNKLIDRYPEIALRLL